MEQQPIRDTVDEVCTAVNSFIYDIIAANQKDDARKLLSLALKVRKFLLNANLGGFVNALRKYITGELIDKFIEQLIEEYTTEEQRKAFIKEVCEIVLATPLPEAKIAEKFLQILNKEHVTEKYSNTSLHLAAEQGNLNAVKYFVEKGADISSENEMGYTPLHLAAKQGNLDIVKYLIEKGANPDAIDGDGKTPLQRANEKGISDIVEYLAERVQQVTEVPQVTEDYSNTSLHLAAEQGNLNAVKYFVEKGTDISAKNERGKTPLHLAAKQSNLDIVKYLMEKGVDVNAKDRDGNTPLHIAARRGLLDIAKFLLEKGADVDAQENKFGRAPLHLAASKGHLDIVKYLIEKGANPKATDSNGKTPLQRAAQKGHLDVVEYLKGKEQQVTERQQTMEGLQVTTEAQRVTEVPQTTEGQQITEDYSNISLHFAAEQGNLNAVKYFVEQGADVNANNWHAGTPLHLAVWNGHLDVVKYLIANGASVNLKDSRRNAKGWAPLHDAAHRGYLDIVKCLVEKGADINAQDNYDSITPLHEAALYGHLAVVEELIEKKANINIKNKRGYTPLHSAALNGYLTVVEKLIEKGADINAKNAYGETPLDIARSRGNSQVVEFLSSYQHGNRDRRDVVSGNSWTNNSIVNWVKGLASSTESPALLTSREHNNHTVTAIPEINTTVVNNTIMLGILAAGLFNKTKYKQPIHENLLSPREQSMRLNNIDENMIIRAIQQGEEKFGDPDTKMDEAKVSGNKTRNVERNK